jgi:actin-related protein 6
MHLVIDNGLHTVKAGYAGAAAPSVTPNAVVRLKDGAVHVGAEYLAHSNLYLGMVFKRPYEQGNLVLWEMERPVWDTIFKGLGRAASGAAGGAAGGTDASRIGPAADADATPFDAASTPFDAASTHLLLTETPFQLPRLSINTDQIVFEEYGFHDYYRCTAALLVPWQLAAPRERDFTLVIDAGAACTWIVPVVYQNVHWRAVKKYPVGGRMLSGLLRELVSFRHYDVSEELVLVGAIKEQTLFVAPDFGAALAAKERWGCDFVLPDFKTTATGYVMGGARWPGGAAKGAAGAAAATAAATGGADLQTLHLTDERFTPPESFFHPEIIFNSSTSSLKIHHATLKNLVDLVVEAIMACPEVTRPLLSANISLVGGTARMPGFAARLEQALVRELPLDWFVKVHPNAHDAAETVWHGGAALAALPQLADASISKQEYFEHGSNWCQRQFGFKNI